IPSPPMTARRSDEVGSGEVTGGRLVVVGAFAPVVPQVERGLDGLVAVRVLGLVVGRPPVGIHVVHRNCAPQDGLVLTRMDGGAASPGGGWRPSPRIAWRPGRSSTWRGADHAGFEEPAAGLLLPILRRLSAARPATPITAARWPCVRPRRGSR